MQLKSKIPELEQLKDTIAAINNRPIKLNLTPKVTWLNILMYYKVHVPALQKWQSMNQS